jgi:Activator of Hsp90 ATPase homolog 1-like protein
MTRFGVMKHLRLLEDAGLVASRKVGRQKFHYLNPVPIRLIYDRWIRKYEPWASALVELKTALEPSGDRMPEQPPTHVYELCIRTSPERLWQAITSPEYTSRYFHGRHFESSWQPGSAYRTLLEAGQTLPRPAG